MHIALVGMSNVGKSYWAKRLAAEAGFELIECDQLIERKLNLPPGAEASTGRLAQWMGQPFEAGYAETSRKYLAAEAATMQEIIARLQQSSQKPIVIDTSGSVIHLDDRLLRELRTLARVVYFDLSLDAAEDYFALYLKEPKPVIWGVSFAPRKDEAPDAALKRCYPDLLGTRMKLYKALAHVTIPPGWRQKSGLDAAALLEYIQKAEHS